MAFQSLKPTFGVGPQEPTRDLPLAEATQEATAAPTAPTAGLAPRTASGIRFQSMRPEGLYDEAAPGIAGTLRPLPDGGYGRLLSIGGKQLVQSAVGLADLLGIGSPELSERIARSIEQDYEKLTPEMQKLVDAKWASLDENSVLQNPEAVLAQLTMQLPTLLATMAVPLGVAGRAGATAARLATEAGATRAAAQAARVSAATRAGGIAGAVTEGATTAGLDMDQIRQGVTQMPLEVLTSSPGFREIYERVGDEQLAREEFINSLKAYPVASGAVTALLGGTASSYLSRMLAGAAGTSRLGNAAVGALVEGPLTEAPQELAENYAVDSALQQADPNRPVLDDPWESALAAAGLGAAMGGPIGLMSRGEARPDPGTLPPVGEPPPPTSAARPQFQPEGTEQTPAAPLPVGSVEDELDAAEQGKRDLIEDEKKTAKRADTLADKIVTLSQADSDNPDLSSLADMKKFIGQLNQKRLDQLAERLKGEYAVTFAQAMVDLVKGTPEQRTAFLKTLGEGMGVEEQRAARAAAAPAAATAPASSPAATVEKSPVAADVTADVAADVTAPPAAAEPAAPATETPDPAAEAAALRARLAELEAAQATPPPVEEPAATTEEQGGDVPPTTVEAGTEVPTGTVKGEEQGGDVPPSKPKVTRKSRAAKKSAEEALTPAVAATAEESAAQAENEPPAASYIDEAVKDAERRKEIADAAAEEAATQEPSVRVGWATDKFFRIRKEAAEKNANKRDVAESTSSTDKEEQRSGAKILRDEINSFVTTAVETGYLRERPPIHRKAMAGTVGRYMEEVLTEMRGADPILERAMVAAIESGDPQRVREAFDELRSFMRGESKVEPENLPLLGTTFEPLESQFARARRKAKVISEKSTTPTGRPVGVAARDFSGSVQGMAATLRRMLREMAAITSNEKLPTVDEATLTGAEDEAAAIAAKRADKRIEDAIVMFLDRANRELDPTGKNPAARLDLTALDTVKRVWSTPDHIASMKVARDAYNQIADMIEKIERTTAFQRLRERDRRIAEVGRRSTKPKPSPVQGKDTGVGKRAALVHYRNLVRARDPDTIKNEMHFLAAALTEAGMEPAQVRASLDQAIADTVAAKRRQTVRLGEDGRIEHGFDTSIADEIEEELNQYLDEEFSDEAIREHEGEYNIVDPLAETGENNTYGVDPDELNPEGEAMAERLLSKDEADIEEGFARIIESQGMRGGGRNPTSALGAGRKPAASTLAASTPKEVEPTTYQRQQKSEAERAEENKKAQATAAEAKARAAAEQLAKVRERNPAAKTALTVNPYAVSRGNPLKSHRARGVAKLAELLNVTTLPKTPFLRALQERYSGKVRAQLSVPYQFFRTFNQQNSDSAIMGGFLSELNDHNKEGLAEFRALADEFITPERRSDPKRGGSAKFSLDQARKAVLDFVKATGFDVPVEAQWRVVTTKESAPQGLLDLDTEVDRATREAAPPDGVQLPSGPGIARYTPEQIAARAEAKARVEAHNAAIKKAFVPTLPEITYQTFASREEALAVARDSEGNYKKGMHVERVTMEQVVNNYLDAMREAAVVGLKRGELILNAPVMDPLLDDEVAEQSGEFVDTLQRLVQSFSRMNSRPLTEGAALTGVLDERFTSVDSRTLLKEWLDSLPQDAAYRPIIERMLGTDVSVPIVFLPGRMTLSGGNNMPVNGQYQYTHYGAISGADHAVYIRGSMMLRDDYQQFAGRFLRTLIHEMVHAHTSRLLREIENGLHPELARNVVALQSLLERAKAAAKGDKHYGLTNLHEFVAEAFVNPAFRDFLKSVKIGDKTSTRAIPQTLWERFANWVSRLITGTEAYAQRFETIIESPINALDQFEQNAEPLFYNEADLAARKGVTVSGAVKQAGHGMKIEPEVLARDLNQKLDLVNRWEKFHLSFMNGDVIERKYRKLGDKLKSVLNSPSNPITRLVDAINRASIVARDIGNAHVKLIERTTALEHEDRVALYNAMIESTFAKVHVDAPGGLLDPVNAHLFKKNGDLKDRKNVAAALAAYRALPADVKKLYSDWREHLSKERALRIGVLVRHAARVRGMLKGEADTLFNSVIYGTFDKRTTLQQLPNGAKLDEKGLEDLASTIDEIMTAAELPGPYFPLRREGEFVVTTVDAGERYVEMYDSYNDAKKAVEEFAAEGREAVVTKKIAAGGAAEGNDILKVADSIINRMDTPANLTQKEAEAYKAVQDQLYNATIRLLSDRAMYGAQLRRKNIRGVQIKDMAKSLEDYSRASVSAISSIDAAYDYNQALKDLRKAAVEPEHQMDNAIPGNTLTEEEQLLVGNLYNEFVLRAKNLAADREVTNIDKILGSIGFFTYLGAPSFWLLNATQTATVGIPVIAGLTNVSYMKAGRSLTNAVKRIRKLTKGMGWRALDDLQAVVEKLPQDQQDIILQLIDDNAIQSTLAFETNALTNLNSVFAKSELGQKARPVYNAVTDVLQTVPDMIERFNRLSMALAVMDLGITDYAKIKDVVLSSQFNYDAANRARVLKYAPKWAGGGMRQFWAPMMMFKTFGVNMAELVYGNMYDGFIKRSNTPAERKQARRVFYGIIGSHTAFGGVYGGLGLGLGQVILSAVNSLMDDEDKLEPGMYLENFLAEHTNDYAAGVVMRGLPAALGADFSSSVNLGSLLVMNRNTDWTEYGGFEQSVYGLLGPVAQYGGGVARETARLATGESSIAQWLEKSVPLKLYSSLSKAFRQNVTGLETRQGQSFMDPSEVNILDTAITAVGLRPVSVAQRQDRFYSDRNYSVTLENRKSEIMKKLATASTVAERNEARREQLEWNRKMRERGNSQMVITASSVQQSRRTRERQQREYNRGMQQGRFTEYAR